VLDTLTSPGVVYTRIVGKQRATLIGAPSPGPEVG
jgi:hypothetical protein